ncbi:MAG: hypothetical protein IPK86_02855 [Neisseriales bacterium]|nr:MAG: hypothetical protein IPK86_02855 [Neisseriales bacterium]
MDSFFGFFLLVGIAILIAIFIGNGVRVRRERQIIEQRFFRDFPDVLLDVPKNQVRDGQQGMLVEPTLAVHEIQKSHVQDEEHTFTLTTPESTKPSAFVLPGESEAKATYDACNVSSDVVSDNEKQVEAAVIASSADMTEQDSASSSQAADLTIQAVDKTLLNPMVDFIVDIVFVDPHHLDTLPCFTTMRRYSMIGYTEAAGWQLVHNLSSTPYQALKIGLQTVDRNGAISQSELEKFCEEAKAFSDREEGRISMPSITQQLAISEELDQFCAEVDVLVNIHVQFHQAVSGAALHKMLTHEGLTLELDGLFHYLSEAGDSLYTVSDEAVSFDKQRLSQLQSTLLTWLFDVPRVKGGVQVFDQGLAVARQIAKAFDGDLVDDNHHLLTDQGLSHIRTQLIQLYQKMENKGIEPGSALSNRLFI